MLTIAYGDVGVGGGETKDRSQKTAQRRQVCLKLAQTEEKILEKLQFICSLIPTLIIK